MGTVNPLRVREGAFTAPEGPAEAEIRAEMDSVCASNEFRRSEQCKRFLTRICDLELQGNGDQINEYSLGVEIFHRPQDYSPAEDGVVRRQAHVLRKKLDSYYAGEGRSHKIRIEVPVGRYVPVFRVQAAELPAPPQETVTSPPRHNWKWLVWGCGALLLVGGAFLAGRSSGLRQQGAAVAVAHAAVPKQVEEIWGPWFGDPAGVFLCLANSKTAIVHHVQDSKAPNSHPEHFRPDPAAERSLRQFFRFPPGGYLFYRPSESKTGIAESIAAVNLAQMFGRYGVTVRSMESRLVNWSDLRNGNFILLGHNESNPWVDKLLYRYPFRLGDSQGIRRYIENTNPTTGEKPSYFKEAARSATDPSIEYGLISMLPGLDHRHKLLLVTGLDGQASQMASEFLSQPASLDQILARLKAMAPQHSGPWYFQLILRAEVHDRLATRADIVAGRVLAPE